MGDEFKITDEMLLQPGGLRRAIDRYLTDAYREAIRPHIEKIERGILYGLPVVVDGTVPPGEIQFRDTTGTVAGRIYGLDTEAE